MVYANNKKTVEIIETVDTEFDKNDWYVTGELEFPVTAEEIQWKEYQTRDEMVAACNLPETLVHEISTDELVRLMLEYPLLGDLMLYDNINTGIEIMSQECNILSELLDREDGAEELLNAYCNLEIEEESLIPEYVLDDISNDYEKLDYYLDNSYIEELIQQSEVNIIQDIFLEGILAQEEFVNKLSDDEIADLANEAENKIFEKEESDLYSYYTYVFYDIANAADTIENFAQVEYSKVDSVASANQIITYVYTPNGSKVQVIQRAYNAAEAAQAYYYTISTYPNVIVKSKATTNYNCHSYAWYSQDVNNNVYWMNDPALYISDGSYKKLGKKALGQKVCYIKGTKEYVHSGIVYSLSNGKTTIISKWGAGPLVCHEVSYCPYSGTPTYFK